MKLFCFAGFLILIGGVSAVWMYRTRRAQAATENVKFVTGLLTAAENNSEAGTKPARDACALLSKDELSAATGMSFVKAESARNGDDESSCDYTPGTGNLYPVTLTVTFRYGKAAMETIQHAAPSMVPGSKAGSVLRATFW